MKRDRKVVKAEAFVRCNYTEKFNDWMRGNCLRRAEFEIVYRMSGTGSVSGTEHYCGQHYGLVTGDLQSMLSRMGPTQ